MTASPTETNQTPGDASPGTPAVDTVRADDAQAAVGPTPADTAAQHQDDAEHATRPQTTDATAGQDLATNPSPAPARDEPAPGSPTSTKPPKWLPRALALGIVAVFVGIFSWSALGALKPLWVSILIAFFLSLALEPPTVWLVKRRWPRAAAAAATLFGSLAVIGGMFALFGNLFVSQVQGLAGSLPDYYMTLRKFVANVTTFELPSQEDLIADFGSDVASSAVAAGGAVLSGVFWSVTILLVAFYLLAAGPRFRRAVCRWVPTDYQDEVLHLWGVVQRKVSDYINTRLVLAVISAIATYIFLLVLGIPNAIPLALFVGIVSQFVPTIGAYIGGALPVMVALTGQGPGKALAVLIFVIAYQQVENLFLAPKLSARALEMNAAISLLSVLAFGAVFGALGAFLALPVAATIQAMATTYLGRHELIESTMFRDPEGRWVEAG